MKYRHKLLWIFFLSQNALAQCTAYITQDLRNVMDYLRQIGYPIAFFMMIYVSIKWITAEGPEDRENGRRGIIYIIIGILLLRTGDDLVWSLLCF